MKLRHLLTLFVCVCSLSSQIYAAEPDDERSTDWLGGLDPGLILAETYDPVTGMTFRHDVYVIQDLMHRTWMIRRFESTRLRPERRIWAEQLLPPPLFSRPLNNYPPPEYERTIPKMSTVVVYRI